MSNNRENIRIAIITSRFNEPVTQPLYQSTNEHLQSMGVVADNITAFWVPGAVEIPLIAQQLAKKQHYDAIICLGVVIRGETGHYDYVCQQVSQGCQQVALANSMPVIFGILTTENKQQALARVDGTHSKKGVYAAEAAIEMIELMRRCQ